MAENLDFKELKKFSTENEQSEINILLSTQRVKANEYLTNKLKDTRERDKEKCSMVSAENKKLQAEILHTPQEKTSLLVTQKALNNANIEQKKNILKAEKEKQEILERVKNTLKKYDDLWEESKARFESLPHVQELLHAKQDVADRREKNNQLEKDEKDMIQQIRKKEEDYRAIDRERIIKFAKYMVTERPKLLEQIKVTTAQIQEIKEKINILKIEKKESKANNQSASIMPRLQRDLFDFDSLNVIEKIRGDDFSNTAHNSSDSIYSIFVIDPTKTTKKNKTPKIDYLSIFFCKPYANFNSEANKIQNFEKKKLINILKDIRIDENEAKMIIADVNPDELQPVETIAASDNNKPDNIQGLSQSKENLEENVLENDEMEEIDLTATNGEELVTPPTQFMDKTQASPKEQVVAELDQAPTPKTQQSLKKQVTFDLSHTEENKNHDVNDTSKIDANESRNSQLDVSDEKFAEIKNIIMKKHNLDLSPQFVYAKNDLTSKKPEEPVFTSKFFPQENTQQKTKKLDTEVMQDDQVKEAHVATLSIKEKRTTEIDVVSSPKRVKITEIQPTPSASGFMFGVNTPMTSTCMEEGSMNATGYEDDDDGDFTYTDPSFLLSPKDTSMQMETQEAISQDMPNFLSGLRKTGLSFFDNMGATSKPDSAQQPGTSGFTFKFGNDEKKNSGGGFFSMFQ